MDKLAVAAAGAAVCFVIAGCAVQAGAPSPSAEARGTQCFLASQVNGFSPVSDTVMDVKVGAGRYYRLSLQGSCPDAAFRNRVALRTLSGGNWICQGLDAEIVVPDAMGGQRCLVREVQPITKAVWDAGSRKH